MHILVKFACLFVAAVFLANMEWRYLWLVFVFLTTSALVARSQYFFNAVKRVKWLIVLMLIVYAYTTPGEYVHHWLAETRPTYEGLQLASLQVMKLLSLLALLALLIGNVPRLAQLGGLCQLVGPLRLLHLDARPYVLRLWLTLHYVEAQQSSKPSHQGMVALFNQVAVLDQEMESDMTQISLEVHPLTGVDRVQLMLLCLIFVWACL